MPDSSLETEQKLRIQLAAAYRLIDHFEMGELVYNHISARIPGPDHHFLINPFGLMYQEIKASNLVKVDQKGKIIDPEAKKLGVKVNPAGFLIHSVIHQKRADAGCIVHTHTRAGMAVASLEDGLVPFTQEALRFYHRVAYHPFEGIFLDATEQDKLINSLGKNSVLILQNHGLLTIGSTVPQAVCLMYYLERACQTQLAAQATGRDIFLPPEEICEKTAQQHWDKIEQLDELVWPALIRMLEQDDPSYRD